MRICLIGWKLASQLGHVTVVSSCRGMKDPEFFDGNFFFYLMLKI